MPTPRVYADATPLIGLARLRRLDLLAAASSLIYVTTAVWAEAAGHPDKSGVSELLHAERSGTLIVVSEGNPVDFPQLDRGEAETLSAARAIQPTPSAVIVDERKARHLLESDRSLVAVGSLNTVGLIILSKKMGRLSRVQPVLDSLRQENFHMSSQLYEDALRAAGEWPPPASQSSTEP